MSRNVWPSKTPTHQITLQSVQTSKALGPLLLYPHHSVAAREGLRLDVRLVCVCVSLSVLLVSLPSYDRDIG